MNLHVRPLMMLAWFWMFVTCVTFPLIYAINELRTWCDAVERARFFLRSIYVAQETRSSWEGQCRLSRQALRDLSWWHSFHYDHKWNGATMWKKPTQAVLHCDAVGGKRNGWGGALNGKHTARGAWTPAQAEQHITLLEMKAVVRFTIETFIHYLRGRVVRLHDSVCETRIEVFSPTDPSQIEWDRPKSPLKPEGAPLLSEWTKRDLTTAT